MATLYPKAEEKVAHVARKVDRHLKASDQESTDPSISRKLIGHEGRTRTQAERLADKL